MKAKFKVGDKVTYIPKLSGLSPTKQLTITTVNYRKSDQFTQAGWFYSFKGTNLTAAEKDLKSVNNESLKEIVRRVIKENDQDQYIEKIYWLLYPSANKYNKNTSAKDVIDFVKKNFKGDFKAAYNDLKSEDDFQSTRGRYAGYS